MRTNGVVGLRTAASTHSAHGLQCVAGALWMLDKHVRVEGDFVRLNDLFIEPLHVVALSVM